jgi:hypothetical protein
MRCAAVEYIEGLQGATLALPPVVRRWIGRAIDSGWHRIEPGAYDDGGPGGSVCPFVAAAMMAGVWSDGRVVAGHPGWGGPSGPTPEIEDFAAYFDLCAKQVGTVAATAVIRDAVRAGLGAAEGGRGAHGDSVTAGAGRSNGRRARLAPL